MITQDFLMGNYYFVNYFCKFRAIYFKSVVGRTGNAMSRPTPGLCAHDKLPLQAWLGKRWEKPGKRGKSGGQLKNDARPAGGNAFSK